MINDFVKHVDELKSSKHNFFINAADWNKISLPVKLNWKKAKFKKSNASSIPKNSGVYAFLISPENDSLPPFAFLMYIGITGYKADSPSTLRDRYMNYIKEEVGRRQKLSATPDLSGTVLPLCLIPNSA
ncbi:hypothetical protein ACMHYQ_23670, partial [Ectopseudomonas guguanensis]|uniref:hypothetical protein n=1 Tax=Ectopseudomonas guguanensis TaxID=1198456 RepID=UPI0039C0FC53